ncbi:hypothetical protein AALP_AA6G123600 [Arabis alpina]|uniref:Uncharacterized protein n=1 Tax=Arabis alpina TaxID=50452 RepID=A0A087GNS0_ARAAL|nr:hypothetical protein AALP_AA6G123600 [Arabis alpina]
MVVTSRGGRGGSQGRGRGGRATTGDGRVNRTGDPGKQTVESGSRVKPTVGRTDGVSGPSGPTVALTKRTKVALGGVKRTGGDASTSRAPPPVTRREGKGRAGGLDTLAAVIEDVTTTSQPEIDIAGEVPARQSGHTPPQRARSTGGSSSYSSNPTGRSPPVVSRSPDSQATVSVSRTKSVPQKFQDTTNMLLFAQLTSRATSGHHLSNINLNDQPRHQASQSRQIKEEFENEDEEDADDFGDGEPYQAEEFDGYHKPEGLDDEQLLENILALPGRQRPPLLSERKYNWDIGITELVRANFNMIATKRMRGICIEFDQKGNPFGIGGLSQTFNKGNRKVQYATSSSAAVDLEELQEEMKSARQKIAEHDEEIRRRDEENKKRDEENQKRDEENRRRDAELLELRQSHSRVSEMEKLLSFLKKDDPRIAAYLDAANDTNT